MTTTTKTPTPIPLKLHSFAEKEKIPMLHYHRTTPKWSMMRPQATFSFFISCLIMSFIRVSFKGCSWQPIPRHSRCVDWHTDGIVKCASSRAFNLYAWPRISFFPFDFQFLFLFVLETIIGCKGCSWRPLPAHPHCADWHNDGIVEFARSRAFVWLAVLYIM